MENDEGYWEECSRNGKERDMGIKKSIKTSALILLGSGICVLLCVLFAGLFSKLQGKGSDEPVEILVLGDSIWDLVRDETGVAGVLEEKLGNAQVYNLAIKGTQAANTGNGTEDTCLIAMTEYICGQRTCELPDEVAAKQLLSEVPYEQIDYVILAYGLNDYFAGVKQKNPDDYFDTSTYSGALCSGVTALKQVCPNARFVIASPTYCQGYSYGQVVHESPYHDFGGGTVIDYTASAKAVCASFDAIFINNFDDMNISIHNGDQYLIDATHLTEAGRKRYAENVASYIEEDIRQR